MSDHTATVAIIGAGIVGTSIAYHLAARGCTDILILEKNEMAVSGSTALSAAGVRHQFATEVNIRLSKYSIERLKHFSEEVGGHAALQQIGYLFLVNDQTVWEQNKKQVALQNRLGVHTELLKPEEILAFVPETRLDDIVGATYGPGDGFCDPYGIATGYLSRARTMGVRLKLSTPVTGLQVAGERIIAIETLDGLVTSDFVVNAAGAWSGQVAALGRLDVPVQPYRRNAYMTEKFMDFPETIPMTLDVHSGFWMRKEQDSLLFGLAKPDEPAGENLNVDWTWLPSVLEAGMERFPLLEKARLAKNRCWAGLYEITPDRMPILGRHPHCSNYINASGFSGHGVMHSPATGMLMAEEILDGRAHSINIDELRITRFRDKQLQIESNIF
jgi:sarcosine oxidase subunit beta